VLETEARQLSESLHGDALYRRAAGDHAEAVSLRLIPYYAWNNRGEGQMSVWLPLW